MATAGTINSVDHAATLLGLLARQPNLSVTEIAGRMAIPRPTVYRLLGTLTAHGLISKHARRYRLGTGILDLARSVREGMHPNPQAVSKALERLTAATGETSHFAIRDDTHVTYAAKVDSPHPIRMFSHVGWRGPMHATAVGKAILAFTGDDGLADRVAAGELVIYTPRTIADVAALRENLEQIRHCGYAVDDQELIEGLVCIAVPVMADGACIGAVSVAGPTGRLTATPLTLAALKTASREIAGLS